MKRFVLLISLFVFTTVAFAMKSELPRDGGSTKLQACAPTLKNDSLITATSQHKNVTDANCWRFYAASDAKFRVQSSATKIGVQHTIPGGSWYTEAVSNYKFVNFSGYVGTFRSDAP